MAWLSKMTGKTYRLLSKPNTNMRRVPERRRYFPGGMRSVRTTPLASAAAANGVWIKSKPAPRRLARSPPNRFGLHDMVGNVWEWVEDCYHDNYSGAPANGSAWTGGDCSRRVMRGGSWRDNPVFLRSAARARLSSDFRTNTLGFRVARTLFAKAGEITVVPGVR